MLPTGTLFWLATSEWPLIDTNLAKRVPSMASKLDLRGIALTSSLPGYRLRAVHCCHTPDVLRWA